MIGDSHFFFHFVVIHDKIGVCESVIAVSRWQFFIMNEPHLFFSFLQFQRNFHQILQPSSDEPLKSSSTDTR